MLKFEVYNAPDKRYVVTDKNKDKSFRDDYVRITHDHGFLDIRLAYWEKLPMKSKNLLLKFGKTG